MSEPQSTQTAQSRGTAKIPHLDANGLPLGLAVQHGDTIRETHCALLAERMAEFEKLAPQLFGPQASEAFGTYLADAMQRWVLFLDVLRERGNSFVEREKEGFKPVLAFEYEVILDGRTCPRPVNYALVRIKPPEGYPAERPNGRPFVIIDPRAGHGAGIGGSKADSEVGVALRDGHAVYFVIFSTNPEPGQTLADVCAAEAEFLKVVHARHPAAPMPLVIGNCQGGWATMILAATNPGLSGPIVIAGAPLSYWAGEMGKNPLRYLGGLAGGALPALLASDLGCGTFDGAGLINNFEQLNPAKTMFRKYYDVLAAPEEKGAGFLEFERWWSGFYFMTEAEIRWIVENLFIGNRLTRGKAMLDDGTAIDLTRIKAPVIVFASHGDNITPPQQALNWIADLYQSAEEIRARGHVIIYTLHDSIGHLGIFVSAKVASEHHKEITSVVKAIEALPPGLYELIINEADDGFEVDFEDRNIEDIHAHDDGREDETKFAAVAQLSEWTAKTYELTMRPLVRAAVTPDVAQALVKLNPIRQRRYAFSHHNPWMDKVAELAGEARNNREPVDESNPFRQLERLQADLIEQGLNFFRDTRDAMMELTFHTIYASPWMKAVAAQASVPSATHDVTKFPEVTSAVERVSKGGYPEAIVRMLVLLARARGSVSRERLEHFNRVLHSRPPFDSMKAADRTHIINEQSLIVEFAAEDALKALPKLLHDDVDRIRALNLVLDIAGPSSAMDHATVAMFKRLQLVLMTMARDWHEPPVQTEATQISQHMR